MKPSDYLLQFVIGGASLFIAQPVLAQQSQFTLEFPAIEHQEALPTDLKCVRDGGTGLSPELNWMETPDGTRNFAVIMHHYPRGKVADRDTPSHYWLLWNIPAETTGLSRGNTESIGNEGSDKDQKGVGYTAPCSPGNASHTYTITLFALNDSVKSLGSGDNRAVDWSSLMQAMQGKIIGTSKISFKN